MTRAISGCLLLCLFSGLGSGSCRSDSTGESEGQDRSNGLTASTTLADALQGRIQPVPGASSGTVIAAATSGAPGVADDGSAWYRIPIWVPDGVRGLQPSLAIEYSSKAGPGILGPRWTVSGLSAITRCQQTLAQDGRQGPIDFAGDTFCLDGQRLVRVNAGAPVNDHEFRTERNPFATIIETSETPGGPLTTFRVQQPDGRIFYYGRTAASRMQGSPTTFPSGSLATGIYAYYLDKILDRFGNSILIQYSHMGFTTSNRTPALIPSTITWGATGDTPGQRSVTFNYRPYDLSDLDRVRWVHGLGMGGGQYLSGLTVSGPDGIHDAVVLKQYNFSYGLPTLTITGEQLLTGISECDGNNVCKKPTTIQWEPGSLDYTRTDLGITDVGLPGETAQVSDVYRRIIPVDLNHDGLDDVVYRAHVPANNGTTGTCLGYMARLAVRGAGAGSSSISFGDPIALGVGTDPDPNCAAGPPPMWPYSSDLVLADVNRDGFPDILSPVGNNGPRQLAPNRPLGDGYKTYLNLGLGGGALRFGDPIFETEIVNTGDPQLSIADTDGDGLPEILRPAGFGQLSAVTIDRAGTVRVRTVAYSGPFSAIDLDGDGTAEVLSDHVRANATSLWQGSAAMSSPTMNGVMPFPPASPQPPVAGALPQYARWLLDLNGDGLVDVAYVLASDPATIWTRLNTGAGFTGAAGHTMPVGAQIGQSWLDGFEPGVRVADFNGDGRQDLVLVDNGPSRSAGPATRSQVTVLLSNVASGLSVQTTSIPIGDVAGGIRATAQPPRVNASSHGYLTSVVADANGDGLPDLLQVEGGRLVSYVRQGNAPGLVTSIAEGTGRGIAFGYAPLGDQTVYSSDPSTCAADPQHLACVVRGGWLAKSLTVSGRESSTASVSSTQTFHYADGLSDLGGRGFLGFGRRDISGPGSRHSSTTFGARTTVALGNGYAYPYAFLPTNTRLDVDTPQGPNGHHFEERSFSQDLRLVESTPSLYPGTLSVLPRSSTHRIHDCPGDGFGGCAGDARQLGYSDQLWTHDACGSVTEYLGAHYDGQGNTIQFDSDTVSYPPLAACVARVPSQRQVTSAAGVESVTRTVTFTPDATVNPTTHLPTGEIQSIEIEPNGDAAAHLIRTFGRDSRGRLTSVSDREVATGQTRTTGFRYQDADGVYVTTTDYPATGSAALSTRVWRHPGLGVIVETDDPNGIAAAQSYDTFGRLLSETGADGATTTVSYADTENPLSVGGVDLSVRPESKATRQINIHLDSFGRETLRDLPVDAARRLTLATAYDGLGRATQVAARSVQGGVATVLNTSDLTFDDMNRLLSDCKLTSSDGSQQCRTNQFNGLSTFSTDESRRSITRWADAMGRLSTQASVLETGTSNATFSYGPFGLLENERVEDGSGQTDVVYDVLGRPTALTRTGMGTRRTTYNAFGEVTSTFKPTSDGGQAETQTFGRDGLGRITSVTSPGRGGGAPAGLDRRFTWDTNADGTAAPSGLGKLIDIVDGGSEVSVHLDYDGNGLPRQKSWTIFNAALARSETWAAKFAYDSQGRIATLTYPTVPGETAPLALRYGYDPYLGTAAAITDTTRKSPLWTVKTRNELGEITGEAMALAGSTITRATSYYLQDGRLKTASLSGSNGKSEESYTYQADGLPGTFGMSGVGGSWTATFDYDNLSRLTSWRPDAGAPTVAYHYDSDGNLTSRIWSGETVSYASTATARTVTTQRGTQVQTDTYQTDFGRIWDTPAISILETDDDKPGRITEKATGQVDTLIYDGTSSRVLTLYGAKGSAGTLLTLDDLFELRRDSSGTEGRCRVRAGGRLIGDIIRSGTANRTATFYLEDGVGSVVAEASDANQTVTARARRDPFGNSVTSATSPYLPGEPTGTDPDGSGRLGFGGHERDRGWGTVEMLARPYSPRLGRFMYPDTILPDPFDRRSHNAYAYVWNRPTSLSDPSGHGPEAEITSMPEPPAPPSEPWAPPEPQEPQPNPEPPINTPIDQQGTTSGGTATAPETGEEAKIAVLTGIGVPQIPSPGGEVAAQPGNSFPGNATNTFAQAVPGLPLSTYDRPGHDGETVQMLADHPWVAAAGVLAASGVGEFGLVGAAVGLTARGGIAATGGMVAYRIITSDPARNFTSNAARGLAPRRSEIGDALLHGSLSVFDSLARAASRVPGMAEYLAQERHSVLGIAELRLTPELASQLVKTLGSGHWSFPGPGMQLQSVWFQTFIGF